MRWVWNEHLMGGKYRRQLVVDGASPKALLQHWGSLQGELQKANPDLSQQVHPDLRQPQRLHLGGRGTIRRLHSPNPACRTRGFLFPSG